MHSSGKRSLEEVKAAGEKKKQKVTQPLRRYNGLINQGATCYLNSVLQVLFMTTEIHDRLDPKSQLTDRELRNFFETLKETTCGAENISQSLEIKNVHEQRDAAECLEMILHKISPQASEVFQGDLRYTTKCSKGHIINEETNPFWTLPLSLKDARDTTYSVERGLKRIFQTKLFSGDNMVYCPDCKKKTQATSGCEMVKSPQILIVLLKRFDLDYTTMSHVKSHCCVEVPRALQIEDKTYKLYGMVDHMGSLRGGHYTATILSSEDRTWYEFDDTLVKKVKEQPFAKTRTYNSCTAYLLVYRGRDKVKERPDERRGNRVEESQRELRKEREKEALSHQVQGKGSDTKLKKVSSFNEDFPEARLHRKENTSYTSYSGKQHPDDWTKAEARKQRSKDEDEKPPQPCQTRIMKNPLFIALLVIGCAFIVILPVILTTLN